MTSPITYDRYGRMNYHPDYHPNQKKDWLMTDIKFLIENYVSMGPEACSLALGRTIHTVMTRAYELRKSGAMPKRKPDDPKHKRIGAKPHDRHH